MIKMLLLLLILIKINDINIGFSIKYFQTVDWFFYNYHKSPKISNNTIQIRPSKRIKFSLNFSFQIISYDVINNRYYWSDIISYTRD